MEPEVLPPATDAPMSAGGPFLPVGLDHPTYQLPPEELSQQALFSAAETGRITKRAALRLYLKVDATRAVQALRLWEAEPNRLRDLMGRDRGALAMRDLREYLWAVGRLPQRDPD